MSTIDRAAEVITPWMDRGWVYPEDNAESAAQDLAEEGLLTPELPEPTGTTPDGEATWQLWFDTVIAGGTHVWGGGYMEALAPDEARALALALLAAATHAEGVGTDGQDD